MVPALEGFEAVSTWKELKPLCFPLVLKFPRELGFSQTSKIQSVTALATRSLFEIYLKDLYLIDDYDARDAHKIGLKV